MLSSSSSLTCSSTLSHLVLVFSLRSVFSNRSLGSIVSLFCLTCFVSAVCFLPVFVSSVTLSLVCFFYLLELGLCCDTLLPQFPISTCPLSLSLFSVTFPLSPTTARITPLPPMCAPPPLPSPPPPPSPPCPSWRVTPVRCPPPSHSRRIWGTSEQLSVCGCMARGWPPSTSPHRAWLLATLLHGCLAVWLHSSRLPGS